MTEIEKKFLVSDGSEYPSQLLDTIYPSFQELVVDVTRNGEVIKQGYLPIDKGLILAQAIGLQLNFNPAEARLRDRAGNLTFTLKGDGTVERDELETPISPEFFNSYWPETAGKRVQKIRLKKPYLDHILEIDFYLDRKLVVVEVEVGSREEAESFPKLGKDITADKSFKNKNLAK